MDTTKGVFIIVGACVLILAMGFFRKKMELVINFILRVVTGTVGIYILNEVFAIINIGVYVGINPASILTAGVLGIPGVVLLYGVVACTLL